MITTNDDKMTQNADFLRLSSFLENSGLPHALSQAVNNDPRKINNWFRMNTRGMSANDNVLVGSGSNRKCRLANPKPRKRCRLANPKPEKQMPVCPPTASFTIRGLQSNISFGGFGSPFGVKGLPTNISLWGVGFANKDLLFGRGLGLGFALSSQLKCLIDLVGGFSGLC